MTLGRPLLAHDSGVGLDLDTLGRLLAFAALIAATEFYALVIHRRAALRRAQAPQDEPETRVPTEISPAPRAFRIDAGDQGHPPRWVARWRGMSPSATAPDARDDVDDSAPD